MPAIDRKAPIGFELAMKTVGVEALIKRITTKKCDALFRRFLKLGVKAFVAALEARAIVDRHSPRREVSLGSLPA